MEMSGKTGVFYSDVIDGYKLDIIFAVKIDNFADTIREIQDESCFRYMKKNQTKCLTDSLKRITLS